MKSKKNNFGIIIRNKIIVHFFDIQIQNICFLFLLQDNICNRIDNR